MLSVLAYPPPDDHQAHSTAATRLWSYERKRARQALPLLRARWPSHAMLAPSLLSSKTTQQKCIAMPRPQGPCRTISILFPVSSLRTAAHEGPFKVLPSRVAVHGWQHHLAPHVSQREQPPDSRELHSRSSTPVPPYIVFSFHMSSNSPPCPRRLMPPPAPPSHLPRRPMVVSVEPACMTVFFNATPGTNRTCS